MQQAAQLHSEDMLAVGTMSHTGSDSSNAGERLHSAGYQWRAWAEHIAYNQSTVEELMSAWLSSKGHCENIMRPLYTEFGAGMAGFYWTQVFATPF